MSYAPSGCRTCGAGGTLAQWETAPPPPTGLPINLPPPTGGLPSTQVPGGATTPPGYVPDPSAEPPPAEPPDPTEPAPPGLRPTDPENGGARDGGGPAPPGAPPPDGFLGDELMGWAVGMAVGALLLARTRG